jgi:hypothetical protein
MARTTPAVDRDADDGEQGRRKKGGFRTMPLILGESIDRVPYLACINVMQQYS